MTRSPIITLLTDFGSRDAFVGIMKGVMLGINPSVSFVDLSHDIPPQDILAGALVLRSAVPFFPAGTIHVAVIDPGVGSKRRALLVETPEAFFVGPDNGLLSLAAPASAATRVIHLTNEEYFLLPRSQTFHGRDVFAPVAAHLSRGVSPKQFGDSISTEGESGTPRRVGWSSGRRPNPPPAEKEASAPQLAPQRPLCGGQKDSTSTTCRFR